MIGRYPTILFRDDGVWNEEEEAAAEKYFPCTNSRMDFLMDQLVIGRYSVLPFYRELELDLARVGARLINSHKQHRYIADMQNSPKKKRGSGLAAIT